MKVLQSKGIIDVRPKTGIGVRPWREWRLLDPDVLQWRCEGPGGRQFIQRVLETRHVLEPPAAELAAVHASDDEIATIVHWGSRLLELLDDPDAFVVADREFHAAIFRAGGNEILAALNAATWLSPHTCKLAMARMRREDLPESTKLHRAVAAAVASRDGHEARALADRIARKSARDVGGAKRVEREASRRE